MIISINSITPPNIKRAIILTWKIQKILPDFWHDTSICSIYLLIYEGNIKVWRSQSWHLIKTIIRSLINGREYTSGFTKQFGWVLIALFKVCLIFGKVSIETQIIWNLTYFNFKL
jgi:hypothetical protein